jgi:hypothetical protein
VLDDELEHDGRDVRLRDAPEAKSIGRPDGLGAPQSDAALGDPDDLVAPSSEDDHPRSARCDQLLGARAKRRRERSLIGATGRLWTIASGRRGESNRASDE